MGLAVAGLLPTLWKSLILAQLLGNATHGFWTCHSTPGKMWFIPTLLLLWAGACALMCLPPPSPLPTFPVDWRRSGVSECSYSKDQLSQGSEWVLPSSSHCLQNVLVCGWYLPLVYFTFPVLWLFGHKDLVSIHTLEFSVDFD